MSGAPSPLDKQQGHDSNEKSKSTPKAKNGPALHGTASVSLALPPTLIDPLAHLSPLRDDRSAYAVVARSCLHISQYAGHGSSAYIEESNSVSSSGLFHDKSHADTISSSFSALIECIQNHKDRRCRIIACKTLALVARAAYARIRNSPLLFSTRESTASRLEDECGSEVPVALSTVALNDSDDGVSATAVESLGILTLSTSNAAASIYDDELLREIQTIAFARQAPYAPSLRSVADEDPSVPQLELQFRIFQNVLAPRLLQLVSRIIYYSSSAHHRVTLPFVTTCLINQLKTSPALSFGMDRSTYAKRWVELDAAGLVRNIVAAVLLPAMQTALDGDLAHTAAQCALRLANACPTAAWVLEVCQWAVVVLKEEISSIGALETRMGALSALIIALRAIPLPERFSTLVGLVDQIRSIPYTTLAPHGVVSPGLLMEGAESIHYRRPARVGFLTEIALSFFMDGPLGDCASNVVSRSNFLRKFLLSPPVTIILRESKHAQLIRLRDEIFLVFCTVACEVGRRFRVSPDGSVQLAHASCPEVEEWSKLSFVVLSVFKPCVRWGQTPEYMEEDLSTLTAGQASYIRLFQEFLHFVSLLHGSSSVALKLTPNACPPHLLWDQMTESATFLNKFDAVTIASDSLLQDITNLFDDLLSVEMKQGILSHHMRLFILALAADQWVQGRYIRKQSETTTSISSNLSLNKASVRDLLIAVSPKRILAKLMEHHRPPVDPQGKKKKDPIKKLAQETVRVCVACIENVALTASDWRRRYGASPDVSNIVNMAVASLQGRLDNMQLDENMKQEIRQVMGPSCEAGIERIQSFFESADGADGENHFPVSPLVTQPMKYKIKPLVSASKPPRVDRDSYIRGYLMQMTRQIIAARVDMLLSSMPTADAVLTFARARNWLRLSLPPLPESRDARGLKGNVKSLLSWGSSVTSSSGGSDAASIILAHTMRRCLRYDNEEEFRLMALMRVCNTTAVEVTEGFRLEFGVFRRDDMNMDATSLEIAASLGINTDNFMEQFPLISATVVYKEPVKAGEQITWELALPHLLPTGKIALCPSVIYRGVEAETIKAKKVGDKASSGSAASNSKSGEDDFQVAGKGDVGENEVPKENVCIPGDPMHLSPLTGLQPCPLVFFRDSWGDIDTFRFLWFRMPHEIPAMEILPASESNQSSSSCDSVASRVAAASALLFDGEAIPGGFAMKLWAFMSLTGERVFCVLAETDPNNVTLNVKSDSKDLLFSMVASLPARKAVVSALVDGMCPRG